MQRNSMIQSLSSIAAILVMAFLMVVLTACNNDPVAPYEPGKGICMDTGNPMPRNAATRCLSQEKE